MKKRLFFALLGVVSTPAMADIIFNSPSGNISCGSFDDHTAVSCYIAHKDNPKPAKPKPKSCRYGDWGNEFWLDNKGKADMGCYTDFPYFENAKILPYGKSINGRGWTCTSQTTGMRCVNKDGHGFSLSRAKQTLF